MAERIKGIKELSPEELLKHSQEAALYALNEAMGRFDFEKAARALKGCGWKYQGAATSPDPKALRKIAKEALVDTIQAGSGCKAIYGPLAVEVHHWGSPEVVTVTISLVPVCASSVYVDFRALLTKKVKRAAREKRANA